MVVETVQVHSKFATLGSCKSAEILEQSPSSPLIINKIHHNG